MSCSATVVVDSNCMAMVARITCGCAISLSSNLISTTGTIWAASWMGVAICAISALHMGMAASPTTASAMAMRWHLSDSSIYAVLFQT